MPQPRRCSPSPQESPQTGDPLLRRPACAAGQPAPYPGDLAYRAAREWPWVPGVDRPIGHAAGTSSAGAHDGWLRGALVLVAISRPASGDPSALCRVPPPSPEPTTAGPDGRRVLSGRRSRSRVTPQAPLTGSGWR